MVPAWNWLKEQPLKKYVVKIENLPKNAQEESVWRYFQTKIANMTKETEKVVLERDQHGKSKQIAWFVSENK